jgi:hypothetical protein
VTGARIREHARDDAVRAFNCQWKDAFLMMKNSLSREEPGKKKAGLRRTRL